jgi:putative ABC transport system permease protein
MILRKMIKNKWLELSLLLGLVLSVALTSSMPIYTNAILQRLLLKDLQNLQTDSQQYPGVHWSSAYLPSAADLVASVPAGQTAPTAPPPPTEQKDGSFQQTDAFLKKNAENEFGLPLQYFVRERATDKYQFVPTDPDKVDATKQRIADFTGISGIEDHIKLVDGRMPEKNEPVNGVYEVLVVPDALTNMNLVLGNEFQIQDDAVSEPIKVKPVGVIDREDYNDVFWYNYLSSYSNSFLINFDIFERDFTTGKKLEVTASYWYFALDYSKITLDSVTDFVITSNVIEDYLANHFDNYSTKAPALQTLGQYFEKEAKLRVMLWSLNVPVMLMLGFYLYMVSNLITERQKTEIAVLRSRGASRWQILLGYTIEGIVLGAVALLVGPYFGEMLTKVLGASNGFLEFVQRAKLDVNLNREAFQYALIAVASSVLMTLIPALLATKVSIVGHKQAMARMQKMSFWHKFGVDVVLVGIALYGLYNFRNRLKDMVTLGLSSTDLKVDPLLFLVPALFILGSGLIILRVYPWFVRALYWIGRRFWPPSLYSTLIQVGRSTTQYQFIMVFLIITVATGLFSASAARTINRNAADKISYATGSDIALKIKWENNAPPPISDDEGDSDDSGDDSSTSSSTPAIPVTPVKTQYSEPPFLPFTTLPGVEHAAKVFTKDIASFTMGKEKDTVKLMGIDTDDFGMTTWYRDQLLDHHINEYLNLIAGNPSAALISRSLADAHNVKEGDHILVNWQGVDNAEFVVYGIIDFWPTWNPNPGPDDKVTVKTKSGSTTQIKYPMLVVGQLPYIQNNLALEPYDIWLKLKPDGTSAEVYKAIEDQSLPVVSLEDSRQELIKTKNDPFQLAINGVMTLGFLISIVISFFGFLLYWILSLSARTLQFGILRAMGVSFIQLVAMIVVEQILTSGAAIGIGMVIGNATSELFVPMFQMSFDPRTQVPPFKVTFDPRDQQELYLIVTAMITFGLCILGYMLSRIKIHQAVKLGED